MVCSKTVRNVKVLLVSAAQRYVAIDWDPEMKKRFYNDHEAEVSVGVYTIP